VLDAAMSVHLDRFLNVPAARLPQPEFGADPDALLETLPRLLDQQQQVDEAGALVASFLAAGGDRTRLVAAFAIRQHELLRETHDADLPLIAAARYLAAHATTTRSERQTFEIARPLHRGEKLYEEPAD
jgi:hypothetical protein